MNSKIKSEDNSEIDLIKLIIIIWNGKYKIILIAALTIIITMAFEYNKKPAKSLYLASTEIRPITTFDEYEYNTYNLYFKNLELKSIYSDEKFYNTSGTFRGSDSSVSQNDNTDVGLSDKNYYEKSFGGSYAYIERMFLINLFTEKLSDYSLFKKLIKDLVLVNKKNYQNEQDFEQAVTKLAASIQLLPPNLNANNGKIRRNWSIEFLTDDIIKWKTFLDKIEKPTNNEVRIYLTRSFKQFIENERELKKFAIEDIKMKINDSLTNYEIKAERRILYLQEQAKIARELDVAKNNFLESQSFKTESAVITNIISDIPYYMKGYEMIEKEIELIQERNDKKAFTDNLNELEIKLRMLDSDRVLDRLETLFEKTPIFKENVFYAAKLMTDTTKYSNTGKSSQNLIKTLLLASILGTIIGMIFVLMSNAIKNYK